MALLVPLMFVLLQTAVLGFIALPCYPVTGSSDLQLFF
jgi:hypothetical protein